MKIKKEFDKSNVAWSPRYSDNEYFVEGSLEYWRCYFKGNGYVFLRDICETLNLPFDLKTEGRLGWDESDEKLDILCVTDKKNKKIHIICECHEIC